MSKFTKYSSLILEAVVLMGAFFVLIYAFVFQFHEVSGQSMFPTLKNKEYVLTSLLPVRLNKLTHGDLIVFHSPIDQEKLYIKRIIGLPGDKISLQNGKIYVNDKLLNESAYLSTDIYTSGAQFLKEGEARTVVSDTVFVLGDNRAYSSDSREWGFLERKKIVGRSMYRIWPITEFLVIKNPY